MNNKLLEEIHRLRRKTKLISENQQVKSIISNKILEMVYGEDKNYDYSTFDDFLSHEYGFKVTSEELVEAIKAWASNYMMGLNPGDFQGVAKYVNQTVYNMIKFQASENYIEELLPFLTIKK
jgi:hypothetical protein